MNRARTKNTLLAAAAAAAIAGSVTVFGAYLVTTLAPAASPDRNAAADTAAMTVPPDFIVEVRGIGL
jgi:hypothetical protein